MHLKKMLFLTAFAVICLFCVSCETTKQKQDGPDLSKLTPEQRAEYEAYLNAKRRFEERNFQAPESSNKSSGEKSKKKFKYVPYSKQKRDRLMNTDESVLLDDKSSVFFWRKDSGRRSEKLHEQHVNELEKQGYSYDK